MATHNSRPQQDQNVHQSQHAIFTTPTEKEWEQLSFFL
jgi:hypothetical protein